MGVTVLNKTLLMDTDSAYSLDTSICCKYGPKKQKKKKKKKIPVYSMYIANCSAEMMLLL